jgi:hypothetical protein
MNFDNRGMCTGQGCAQDRDMCAGTGMCAGRDVFKDGGNVTLCVHRVNLRAIATYPHPHPHPHPIRVCLWHCLTRLSFFVFRVVAVCFNRRVESSDRGVHVAPPQPQRSTMIMSKAKNAPKSVSGVLRVRSSTPCAHIKVPCVFC